MGRHFRGSRSPPRHANTARRGTPLRSRPQGRLKTEPRAEILSAAKDRCFEQMSNANLLNGPRKRLNFESLRAGAIQNSTHIRFTPLALRATSSTFRLHMR